MLELDDPRRCEEPGRGCRSEEAEPGAAEHFAEGRDLIPCDRSRFILLRGDEVVHPLLQRLQECGGCFEEAAHDAVHHELRTPARRSLRGTGTWRYPEERAPSPSERSSARCEWCTAGAGRPPRSPRGDRRPRRWCASGRSRGRRRLVRSAHGEPRKALVETELQVGVGPPSLSLAVEARVELLDEAGFPHGCLEVVRTLDPVNRLRLEHHLRNLR